MAIEIAKSTPYSVPARYHAIGQVNALYAKRRVDVLLLSYASDRARQTGAEPLAQEWVQIQFERLGTEEPTRAQIYEALKATEAFKDGVGV